MVPFLHKLLHPLRTREGTMEASIDGAPFFSSVFLLLDRDYLTGFHKRKQARRRFGLAMQEIKDRKERLEERKEVRKEGPRKSAGKNKGYHYVVCLDKQQSPERRFFVIFFRLTF